MYLSKTKIEENITKHYNFIKRLLPYIFRKYKIIFIDESGFNMKIPKAYACEKKNQKLIST